MMRLLLAGEGLVRTADGKNRALDQCVIDRYMHTLVGLQRLWGFYSMFRPSIFLGVPVCLRVFFLPGFELGNGGRKKKKEDNLCTVLCKIALKQIHVNTHSRSTQNGLFVGVWVCICVWLHILTPMMHCGPPCPPFPERAALHVKAPSQRRSG